MKVWMTSWWQVEIAVGLVMMPAAFFIMTLWAAIRKEPQVEVFALRNPYLDSLSSV